jgi:hypothetical protein
LRTYSMQMRRRFSTLFSRNSNRKAGSGDLERIKLMSKGLSKFGRRYKPMQHVRYSKTIIDLRMKGG